ncbi:tRNA pseudouridine(55) synthase TruB [Finegoldia magna]|uniref:tRNA pseudouridine synthase B n=2 Tax=Finegoldia magna TaxID=1260 RepID=A0A233VIS5_FINMA|nr:tRNA pseudouridine(55) synthase TruB [Finegoldia magna]MDU5507762.1 tRNA pseudouridine(55) synthase TruB [Finegoldia magna]MDU6879649.1 tRNA pseudouridine(55) synthase TruB [Finegoldia magna]OXZ32301.1 tRNA pseudouridine(55) synthase TruB [Finegoldia magna]PMC61047.1 tRNA pseudouridine(55) synthase TruB [Finegoldia magna]
MDCVINVFKEKGYTSQDVVSICKGILKTKKIGHAGTLDPDATGVLLLGVGKGTKITEYLMEYGKTYIFEMVFGTSTDTLDLSGNVTGFSDKTYDKEKLKQILDDLNGKTIEQVPPMYSAVKVNGKKLYEYARENKEIKRKSRKITIYNIEPLHLLENSCIIKVRCSKGTYIRVLIEDIAKKLDRLAYMKSLIRVNSGGFDIKDSIKIESLRKCNIDDVSFSVYESLTEMKSIKLDDNLYKKITNGVKVNINNKNIDNIKVVCKNKFIGIGSIEDNILKMNKVFDICK